MKFNVNKISELPGHKDSIYSLCKGKDNYFFSSGGDGLVVQWDSKHLDKPGKVVAQCPSPVYSLIYLLEENRLLVGTRSGIVYLFDLNSSSVLAEKELEGEVFKMKAVGEKGIFVGTGSGKIYFLNQSNLLVLNELHLSEKSCRSLAIHPNERIIATGWSDNFIRIIDIESFAVIQSFEAHQNSVFSLSFTKDGEYLLSGSRDAHIKVWDANNFTLFIDIPAHLFAINDIQFSPDGKYFASASRDKTVKIWDAEYFELLKVLDLEKSGGHTHSVNSLFWLDNTTFLSAGDDRKIEVWQLT